MKKIFLSRRTLLRGAFGTALGLPLLEAMTPSRRAEAAPECLRYLVCFGGYSLGADDDPAPSAFVPTRVGSGYTPGAALAPLGSLADEVTVVSGLRIPMAIDESDPVPAAGRIGGDSFHFHPNPLFTGNRQVGGAFDATVTGASSDRIVANTIGADSVFDTLTYRVQALFYMLGGQVTDVPRYRDTLSFTDNGGPSAVPAAPLTSPELAYQSLVSPLGSTDPRLALELAKRRSVLDLVDRRMGGLVPRLSHADRMRLEEHYDAVRRLERLLTEEVGGCQPFAHPGADPPLGSQFNDPMDFEINAGYSDEETRSAVFHDLIRLAFTCDLSRSATLMYSMFQSFMNVHEPTGLRWNQHSAHHDGGNTTDITQIIAWHMRMFSDLLTKLRDTPEGDKNLLDRCAIVFLNEGGHGPDPAFGTPWSSHTTEGMACLVAGGAGGLVRGQHVVAPAAANHPANVLITAMNAVGANVSRLGEVTGSMAALR